MRICPECQTRYDDDVESCPTDGELLVELPAELSGNPPAPEPQQAGTNERTSMIDLEAIEAERAARRAEQEAENPPEDEKTPPPEGPVEDDVEAFINWYINRVSAYLTPRHEHVAQLGRLSPAVSQ